MRAPHDDARATARIRGRRDLDAALGEPLERADEQIVLAGENARGERVVVVAGQDGHGRLRDDRAGVGARVDQVHGAAGDARSVRERLRLRVDPRERGQERRVDVEHAVRERVEEGRTEQPHEARERDEMGARLAQRGDEGGVVARPVGVVPVRQDARRHPGARGAIEAPGVGPVRHDQAHAGVEAPVADRVEDGAEVRAPAGDEHAEVEGHGAAV